MEPVTHAVIGLAISAFSGDPVELSNPIALGCAIGAMSPDIDVLAKLKGDYVYLKHHRGITHSIPVLLILAGIITFGLSFFFNDFNFFSVFIWTFMGCLSHTLLDILNSYGAKLFLPFTKKKSMVGILMLYDPVITILSLLLIFVKVKSPIFYISIILSFAAYLVSRWKMKKCAKKMVINNYKNNVNSIEINILPALMAFHKWDFIVSTDEYNIVGQINFFNGKIKEIKRFVKPEQEVVQLFDQTKIGEYFGAFTPIYQVNKVEDMDRIVLQSIDLRYYLRDNFMHHATVIYDDEQNVLESFFHPYNINKNIRVAEAE